MAIVRVHKLGNGTGGTGVSSAQMTVTATTTVGNHIIVAVCWGASDRTAAVTDAQGNTYQQDKTQASGEFTRVFSSKTTSALTSGVDWIKVTWTGGTVNNAAMLAYEYSGLDTTTWADKTAGASGSSNSPSSGATASTSQADELVFGLISQQSSTASFTSPSGTELDVQAAPGSSRRLETQERIVSSATTYTTSATMTGTGSTAAWSAITVTYKMAAGSTDYPRSPSDTGVTASDSVAREYDSARTASDTGATQSSSISLASVLGRAIADTGTTNTDSLARARGPNRSLSDTGVSQGNHVYDVRLTATNSGGSDTKTQTSYIAATTGIARALVAARSLSDTGVTASDSLARGFARSRGLTDTGITQTTAVYSVRLTATNASGSNTKTRTSYITISSDVIGVGHSFTRSLSDLGIAYAWDAGTWDGGLWDGRDTDELSRAVSEPRALSDTGVTQSSSIAISSRRALADTGLTNSDTLARLGAHPRAFSDIGIASALGGTSTYDTGTYDTGTYDSGSGGGISDLVDRVIAGATTDYTRSNSDLGVVFAESLTRLLIGGRILNDTGYQSGGGELIVRLVSQPRSVTDTGTTFAESHVRQPYNQTLRVTETGLTLTDSIDAVAGQGQLSAVAVTPEDLTEFAVVPENLTEVGVL